MKINGLAITVATVLAAAPAGAQQTAKFAKIDCATSKLVIPPQLVCLASNEVAGGDFGGGTAGGLFKYWNAIGKLGSSKAYVYGVEAVDGASEVRVNTRLKDAIDVITPYAKPASRFSDTKRVGDADTVSFTGGDGDSCVAIRKLGPARGTGYRWVAFGLLCGAAGKGLAESELSYFTSNVGFR
jgi:hypothetical protein